MIRQHIGDRSVALFDGPVHGGASVAILVQRVAVRQEQQIGLRVSAPGPFDERGAIVRAMLRIAVPSSMARRLSPPAAHMRAE